MNRRHFIAGLGLFGLMTSVKGGLQSLKLQFPTDGLYLEYRVFYGGNEIGKQHVSVKPHTDNVNIVIEHDINLVVKVLFAVAYSLEHKSTEIWSPGNKLISIDSWTVENGKETKAIGRRSQADDFHITGEYGKHTGLDSLVTTDSFWMASALDVSSIMNTRTGEIADAKVMQLSDSQYLIKADFEHGGVKATLQFENNILAQAEVDSDGHVVNFKRV